MKSQSALISLLVISAMATPLVAESILLKSGDRITGTVIRENEDSYVIEVSVSKGIKDERVIQKDRIHSIDKAQDDERAFGAIKDLVPAPDGLSIDEYEQRIDQVSQFTTSFAMSSKVDEAMGMLRELRAELREVKKGGVKYNGVIYSAEMRITDAYDLDAGIAASKVRDLIADGQALAALREFSAFEADYAPTVAYSNLLPQVSAVLRAYSADLNRLLGSYNTRFASRQKGLNSMSSSDRRNSIAAIEEEQSLLQNRFLAEAQAKVTWVTPHPFCKDALKYALDHAEKVMKSIDDKMQSEPIDGGSIYREAMVLVRTGGDSGQVAELLKRADSVGMPDRYLEHLRNAGQQDTSGAVEQP